MKVGGGHTQRAVASSKSQKERKDFKKNKAACRRKGENTEWDGEEEIIVEHKLFFYCI